MGMVTEWTFTRNGRKTEAKRIKMEETYGPISPDDYKELMKLFEYLIKLTIAEKRAAPTKSEDKDGGSNIEGYKKFDQA